MAKTKYQGIQEFLDKVRNNNYIPSYDSFFITIGYNIETDIINLEMIPRFPAFWNYVAYRFSNIEETKYDRDISLYGFDGQPRVSNTGRVSQQKN